MATAYYTCPECGEQNKVSHGNRRDTDRYVTWLEQQGRLCSDCYSKSLDTLRAEESAAAALEAESAGLPALSGSLKQIAWAETLRLDRLTAVRDLVTGLAAQDAIRVAAGHLTDEQRTSRLLVCETYIADLVTITDAKRWIDERAGTYSRRGDDRREMVRLIRDAGLECAQ